MMKNAFLFSVLLVAALLSAFVAGVAGLLARLWPGMDFRLWVLLCGLTALEAQVAWRYLHEEHLGWFEWQGLRYMLAEWGALALFFKAALYLPAGLPALLHDASQWALRFSSFFDAAYAGLLALGGLVWVLARQFAADLAHLQVQESDRLWEELAKLEADRHTARQRLGRRIFGLGSLLVLFTGLIRLDAGQNFHPSAAASTALLALGVYFALGLLLVGQSWLRLLQGRWWWQDVPVQGEVTRRWFFAALGLLLAALSLAFVLPTGYTLGLLDALWLLFNWGVRLGGYLLVLLLLLFSLLLTPFSWLMHLLTGTPLEKTARPHIPSPPVSAPPEVSPALSGIPWWEQARGVLFWVLFAALLYWVVRQYVRQNRAWWVQMRTWPVLGLLFSLGGWARNLLWGAGAQVVAAAAAGRERLSRVRIRRSAGKVQRVGGSARERIFFYYQALLRRGAQAGIVRQAAETPRQYARRLHAVLEEGHPQVEALTEAFEAERYRPAPDSARLVVQARAAWRGLRRWLRRARRI